MVGFCTYGRSGIAIHIDAEKNRTEYGVPQVISNEACSFRACAHEGDICYIPYALRCCRLRPSHKSDSRLGFHVQSGMLQFHQRLRVLFYV